jgi:hypothetical protein
MEKIKENTRIKWQTIELERKPSTFALKRFSSDCIPDLYIGINQNENKSILLDLNNLKIDFEIIEKSNIKAYLRDKYLILEFTGEEDYFEIFLDLICTIYLKIKDINDTYSSAIIIKDLIIKWSTFFSNKKFEKLGEKEIMGLWGEIYVLKNLIIEKDFEVDDILKAWRGPYDSINDFQFINKNIEIKSIKYDSDEIEISSEYQLNTPEDKILELKVLKLRKDEMGINIKELVDETINIIINKNGQLILFYSALYQKISLNELDEYNSFLFAINSDHTYDVNRSNFPKITEKELNDSIFKVKYKIKLSKIEKFLK